MKTQTSLTLLDPALVLPAIQASFAKLSPAVQWRNPVMFVVFIGSILTTLMGLQALQGQGEAPAGFILSIAVWLWFTVLFANFAEAIAEHLATHDDIQRLDDRFGLRCDRLEERYNTRSDNLELRIEATRAELAKSIEATRAELAKSIEATKIELKANTEAAIANAKAETLRWMFGALAAQTAMIVALVKLIH